MRKLFYLVVIIGILVGIFRLVMYVKENFQEYLEEGLAHFAESLEQEGEAEAEEATEEGDEGEEGATHNDTVSPEELAEGEVVAGPARGPNQQEIVEENGKFVFNYVFRNRQEKPRRWQWSFPKEAILERNREFGLPGDFWQRTYTSQAEMDQIIYKGYFVSNGSTMDVDYPRLTKRHMPISRPLYELLLEDVGQNADFEETIETLMRFCQDIPYEVPPEYTGGRYVHELFPPSLMLIRGKGDCDSKSTLFTSILRHDARFKLVLVSTENPHHMYVGIKGVPKPYQDYFTFRGERYLVCEPVGPSRMNLGALAFKESRITEVKPLF
ncbi:MAG: hypothetical protein HC913_17685 [Microscillaceae bacterium]|nr:hypothetical protein [Microscillaceae bacterium]